MGALNKTAAILGNGFSSLPQSGITWGSQLATGFDRLKIGFYIVWENPLFLTVLQDGKLAAKEANETISVSFSEHGDQVYNCHETGRKGGFGFHLSRADVHLFLSTRKDIKTPNLWVDIGSESCWSPGYKQVIAQIKELVESQGGNIIKNTISEVHLCVDWGLSIESVPIDNIDFWVTRAHGFQPYYNRKQLTGVVIDQVDGEIPADELLVKKTGIEVTAGDLRLRIYDKTEELKRNPAKQGVFASVWGKSNYDDEKVTRIEYQIRRSVLQQMKVNSLSDLEEKRVAVWRYLTYEWARLCDGEIDRVNRHQDRAPLHPWWKAVTQIDFSMYCEPIKREYPRACKDVSVLMDLVGGCMLSVGTILDCKVNDLEGVIYYSQTVIASKLRQMWDNIDKNGCREFELKMSKRWAEIWPMGFEPKPV